MQQLRECFDKTINELTIKFQALKEVVPETILPNANSIITAKGASAIFLERMANMSEEELHKFNESVNKIINNESDESKETKEGEETGGEG